MALRLRSACLALMILAGGLLPRPAAAQSGETEFAEFAATTFGLMCLYLPLDDLNDGARLIGFTPLADPALVARIMPGGPARAWSYLHTGRVMTLARRTQDGACIMDGSGLDVSQVASAIDRLLRRLHGSMVQVAEEEVPRGLPRPPLRARYRLTMPDNTTLLVLVIIEEDPRTGRRIQVVLRGA